VVEGDEYGTRDNTFILFFGGIGAVVLSVLVLIWVVANSSAAAPADDPVVIQTVSPAGSSTVPAVAGATTPAGVAPTPTSGTTGDGVQAPVLRCGDILVPLNKQTRLSSDCVPPDLVTLSGNIAHGGAQTLRREAADAIERLIDAARRDGFDLYVVSSYRSYWLQQTLFNGYVNQLGLAQAERSSARPGQSEHQLGTTVDLSSPTVGFDVDAMVGTPEAAWIEANAWRFGFVVSYPRGAEAITGYMYEPWHIRYVGIEVARVVEDSGRTLHEYLQGR
jgi:zinc D-Ala-D-Ala carboxypeptidase